MTFKLTIECSRDIDKLSIDFSDGSNITKIKSEPEKRYTNLVKSDSSDNKLESSTSTITRKEKFLDTDTDFGSVSQEVVSLPKIPDSTRPASVAPELQNLDI